jgi:hypothetical protein
LFILTTTKAGTMRQYRKLRALLLFARKIRTAFPLAQVAQVEFEDGSFPAEFVEMIEGKQDVPPVEQLAEMRPMPQHVFDCMLLVAWCRNRLNEAFREEESGFCLSVDFILEE